jgi:hypothetical protein
LYLTQGRFECGESLHDWRSGEQLPEPIQGFWRSVLPVLDRIDEVRGVCLLSYSYSFLILWFLFLFLFFVSVFCFVFAVVETRRAFVFPAFRSTRWRQWCATDI